MNIERKVLLFHDGVVHHAMVDASDGQVRTMCGVHYPPFASFIIANTPVSCMTCIVNPEGEVLSASNLPQNPHPWPTMGKPTRQLQEVLLDGEEAHRFFESVFSLREEVLLRFEGYYALCDDDLKP